MKNLCPDNLPGSMRRFSCAALLASSLAAQSASAADVVFDGGPSGTGTDIGLAENWLGDVLPNPATPDTALFNGSVPGDLALTYSGNLNGVPGNLGLTLSLTAAQTGAVSIDSGDSTVLLRVGGVLTGINGTAVTIASGAGAFTLGDGVGTFNVTLGGTNQTSQFFTNNSASMATINSDVVFGGGGGATHYLVFNGTGNWTVNNTLLATGVYNVTIFGAGTVSMNGANANYVGGTYIGRNDAAATNSVLRVGATQALGTGVIELLGDGTMPNAGRLELVGDISLNNAVTLGQRATSAVSIENISGNNTLSGAITVGTGGTQARIQSDAGLLTIAGAVTNNAGAGFAVRSLYLQGAGNGLISGVISNGTAGVANSIYKEGTGNWTLSNANTYSGATTVTDGKLSITNTVGSGTGTGAVAVSGGATATIEGTGIISGPITVTNGSRIAPGVNTSGANANFGSAGTLTIGGDMNLTEAHFDFDLSGLDNTAGGMNDLISTGGILFLSSAVSFTFNGLDGYLLTNAYYTLVTGAIGATGFDASALAANTAFTGSPYTATYVLDGNNLLVSFSAVPEPQTWIMLGLGVLVIAFRLRRRPLAK